MRACLAAFLALISAASLTDPALAAVRT
ncbi:spore coat U domain-containing protein, partial [Mesorhizobium sp. M7A.F.Ca.CA.001.13.2.1]